MADNVASREPRYVGFWKRVLAFIIDTFVILAVIVSSVGGGLRQAVFARTEPGFVGLWISSFRWRCRRSRSSSSGATGAPRPEKCCSRRRSSTPRPSASVHGQLIGAIRIHRFLDRHNARVLWIAFDKHKQGWHDKLAGTVWIHDEKRH